jgi:hypothetical protein
LTSYASFYSVGSEPYRLELGVEVFVESGEVTLKLMVNDDRRDFLSGSSKELVVTRM